MVNRALIQIYSRDDSQISKSPCTHAGGQTDRKTRATFALLYIYNHVHLAQYHIHVERFSDLSKGTTEQRIGF